MSDDYRPLKDRMLQSIASTTERMIVPVFAVLLSLIVGGLIIWFMGYNPFEAYGALIKGSMGNLKMFLISIKKSIPLIFSGLAVAVAFKCSVFNIGVEGQFMAGALTATIAGIYIKAPPFIHIPLVMIAAMAGGMVAAFVPALLKRYFNVGVVISTIMFNYVIKFLVQYFIMGPLHGPGSAAATHAIRDTAVLPQILPRAYQMNLGFVIMLLFVVLVHLLLNKTTLGFEMKAIGMNSLAGEMQGVNVNTNMFLALLISGAIAGIGGGIEISGTLRKMVLDFSTGFGFSGIPIALMAQNNPFTIIFSGLFFGVMSSGSLLMQASVGVSKDIVGLIKGLVVVFLCTENFLRYHFDAMKIKRGYA